MKLIKDLATITTLSEKKLGVLLEKSMVVIANAVYEADITAGNIASVDIGLGILHVKKAGDEIKYKFVPNAMLSDMIERASVAETSPLADVAAETLSGKLLDIYKELL